MESAVFLVKVGELTLKSGNMKDFEQRLVQNARLMLDERRIKITIRAGRMFIKGPVSSAPMIEKTLKHLIGITGWARAHVVEKNLESIQEAVLIEAEKAQKAGHKTFKIESRRADKGFPYTSYEISSLTGGIVHEKGLLTVNVHTPDVVINVEVREQAFVYGEQHTGNRGLPCGTEGKALLLLSGGIDSPVAGYRMLRRGMKIECLYFHSHPYTSPEALEKVENLAQRLALYGIGTHLNIVSFTPIQQRIRDSSPPDYGTILQRICMMKVANMMCNYTGAKAIITGESLGQVASQTIENLTVTNAYAEFPVLRPLIGLDKEEIIATAKTIETYDISILPYEDCCVLFSPKHPITRAKLDETNEIYTKMDIDILLEKAFEERDHKRFGWINT